MPEPEKINFGSVKLFHKKSGNFRVVHADGAWGGVNNTGIVHLTFFAEHPAIPTTVTYPLDKNGLMVNTPTQECDEGQHREMEIDVALSLPAALQVQATLGNFIKVAIEQMNQMNEQAKKIANQAEAK